FESNSINKYALKRIGLYFMILYKNFTQIKKTKIKHFDHNNRVDKFSFDISYQIIIQNLVQRLIVNFDIIKYNTFNSFIIKINISEISTLTKIFFNKYLSVEMSHIKKIQKSKNSSYANNTGNWTTTQKSFKRQTKQSQHILTSTSFQTLKDLLTPLSQSQCVLLKYEIIICGSYQQRVCHFHHTLKHE
ncbi:hypothetical protein RFI_33920, partial [Reticulomyxa filosa]